ncbi:MAG TPA: RNA pseudouridine synthase [Clostridiaceae bacterium]|jgi:23S rRNA pseudouridine1911/1915/1917 synthase|nr:RNA pseudouridine synthase [Clostridiaceae bacterium]HBX47802.1 RNA pseudouridine synthase [Clostridiaceae bacterium]
MENEISIAVNEEDAQRRIDVFLSEKIENMSRSHAQKLIGQNDVLVNGNIVKCNYKIKKNDIVLVTIPEPQKLEVTPEDIDIEILYEDEYLVVVNKPQGMVVHPAAGHSSGTLVNALLSKCSNLSTINGVVRPGIVHRIDKDTSGVLVVAKNDMAHISLAEQIKKHTVNRIYVAIVEGRIKDDEGTINLPIGRHPVERKKMAVVQNGRNAVTHYKVLERYEKNTYIQAKLETGRTHQIRVHMAYIGHPLVGDPVYGFKKQRFKLNGQALHAKTLGFIHPATGEYMEFSAEPPLYFTELLNKLRNER